MESNKTLGEVYREKKNKPSGNWQKYIPVASVSAGFVVLLIVSIIVFLLFERIKRVDTKYEVLYKNGIEQIDMRNQTMDGMVNANGSFNYEALLGRLRDDLSASPAPQAEAEPTLPTVAGEYTVLQQYSNVRESASTDADIMRSLDKGETVTVVDQDPVSGWYILIGGGYIAPFLLERR